MPGGGAPSAPPEAGSDRIVLVGGGKMGGALLAGWLKGPVSPADLVVVEPDRAAAKRLAGLDVTVLPDAAAAKPPAGVVVFAVKPQIMDAVVPGYGAFSDPESVVLSIAAGCPMAQFQRHLGDVPIVRAMPNTPAAIGCGMTVACANSHVSPAQRARCQQLLEAVGQVAWIEDEALMDAVTAVSGSGPAYVFLLTEYLAKAGVEAGLAPALAEQLARTTVHGAGELIRQSEARPSALRQTVTSPGGTTEAALAVLMGGGGLERLLARAVAAAAARSRELAG
jgi:pyrroline-5-carboxylate reductase